VTIGLVLAGLVGCLLWRTSLFTSIDQLIVFGRPGAHWWRLITAPFIYSNVGFAFVCLGTIALYGWLLERRHGPLPVLALFAVGAVGGTAATAAVYSAPVVLGGNGAALALLCAWAIPDLVSLKRREDIDGDLLGTALIAAVVAVMPAVVPGASWVSDAVGVLGGFAVGVPVALTQLV
jgi:membrane associated rhomboid family serine protease